MTLAITLPAPPLQLRNEFSQPDDSISHLTWLKENLKKVDGWIDTEEELYKRLCQLADEGADLNEVGDVIRVVWDYVCSAVATYQELLVKAHQWPRSQFRSECIAGDTRHIERLAELIRTMAIVWDDLDLTVPDEIAEAVWTIRISPLVYLRAMWNLFWSSLRHPFTETTIELQTGRILQTD